MKINFNLILLAATLLIGPGCNKHKQPLVDPTLAGCLVLTCPSYFGTTQTFQYDQSRHMTQRTYDFGYPGYGPFTQTVDQTKTFSSYTHSGGVSQETDVFLGGTGNLYDGAPAWMVKTEH